MTQIWLLTIERWRDNTTLESHEGTYGIENPSGCEAMAELCAWDATREVGERGAEDFVESRCFYGIPVR
jgi:hypothetical protein